VYEDTAQIARSGEMYKALTNSQDTDMIAANSHLGAMIVLQNQSFANPNTLEREIRMALNPGAPRDPKQVKFMYQEVASAIYTMSDPSLDRGDVDRRLEKHHQAVDRAIQITAPGPNARKVQQLQETLERSRQITHAIITTLDGEELKETWEQLRQLFAQLENELPSR